MKIKPVVSHQAGLIVGVDCTLGEGNDFCVVSKTLVKICWYELKEVLIHDGKTVLKNPRRTFSEI